MAVADVEDADVEVADVGDAEAADVDVEADGGGAADKDVQYGAVLEVMDMLQQNQVRKIGLLAKPQTQ
jgi:hypothetical protein